MKIKQVSVFLENKPGHTLSVCETLAKAGIDILTLTLADTHEFGVLHLIVRDPEKTKQVLSDAGYTVNTVDVIAIEVEDRPGGLAAILSILAKRDINIEYMYAFTHGGVTPPAHGAGKKAIIVFRFGDSDAAKAAIEESGIRMFDHVELYERSSGQDRSS